MVQPGSPCLESFLRDYGWTYRQAGEKQWHTGFQGKERTYPLKLSLCDSWVTFQIHPFLKLSIDWECWPELSRYLLELNHDCHMVKIVLNDDGHIGLTLEVLASDFGFNQFSDALGILGYYADYLYDEILGFLDHIGFNYSHHLNLLT